MIFEIILILGAVGLICYRLGYTAAELGMADLEILHRKETEERDKLLEEIEKQLDEIQEKRKEFENDKNIPRSKQMLLAILDQEEKDLRNRQFQIEAEYLKKIEEKEKEQEKSRQ